MKADKALCPVLEMGIRVKPYQHQVDAFNFVCRCFDLIPTGGAKDAEGRSDLQDLRKALSKSQ